jgi:hypothetical protein
MPRPMSRRTVTTGCLVMALLGGGGRESFSSAETVLSQRIAENADEKDSRPLFESTVGMPGHIDQIVLPGSELEVKPLDDRRKPIVLRIVNSFPHGTAFRYDLVYYGLDPGEFDLKDYLRRKDGSKTDDLPSLLVQIRPVLPPGQIQPNKLESLPVPFLGGYRTLLAAAALVWVAGLLAILFVGGKRKAAPVVPARPLTVADVLRPLVEKAVSGGLSPVELAELERTLLVYWRRRLNLEHRQPAEAIALLRAHPEAGPLLEQLEIWLHRPSTGDPVDVAALLEPYRNAPAEAIHWARQSGGGKP